MQLIFCNAVVFPLWKSIGVLLLRETHIHQSILSGGLTHARMLRYLRVLLTSTVWPGCLTLPSPTGSAEVLHMGISPLIEVYR